MQIALTPEQDALVAYCAAVDSHPNAQQWLTEHFPAMLNSELSRCRSDELSTFQARISVLPTASRDAIRQSITTEEAKVITR
jgi:hypothetical protein